MGRIFLLITALCLKFFLSGRLDVQRLSHPVVIHLYPFLTTLLKTIEVEFKERKAFSDSELKEVCSKSYNYVHININVYIHTFIIN